MAVALRGHTLKKVFNWRIVFKEVSFAVSMGETLLITGRNGSGKSTLVKIICGILAPTQGSVGLDTERKLRPFELLASFGLVSPYLQLYDEFTARENLALALAVRGQHVDNGAIDRQLERVGLLRRRNDPVRTYSSGMKQRVKYALALVHQPTVLVLDEPMSNLDAEGTDLVGSIMREQRERGILVVATNDLSDIDRFDTQVNLNAQQ